MELGGGGRDGGGRVRRQLQAVGRVAAYLGGGFLLLSAASNAAVRSLRCLSDANQRKFAVPCGACEGKGTYACRLCRGTSMIEWSPLYDPVFVNPCLCPTCDGTRWGFGPGGSALFTSSVLARLRDGVSESQFSQVLNVELNQIIKAYQTMGLGDLPKFTVIIAQKNHHTKLFQADAPDNVPPGTVVDFGIVHPRQSDFYMCAHAGPIGTSRPTHYHVLLDEIGFSPDGLQKLVLSLSYVYQGTTAVSVVAPICYAHLAAAQMDQFMKFEEFPETSSGSGVPSTSAATVPELPQLHADVCSSMFFC